MEIASEAYELMGMVGGHFVLSPFSASLFAVRFACVQKILKGNCIIPSPLSRILDSFGGLNMVYLPMVNG